MGIFYPFIKDVLVPKAVDWFAHAVQVRARATFAPAAVISALSNAMDPCQML